MISPKKLSPFSDTSLKSMNQGLEQISPIMQKSTDAEIISIIEDQSGRHQNGRPR
jgi:hypothetical protein